MKKLRSILPRFLDPITLLVLVFLGLAVINQKWVAAAGWVAFLAVPFGILNLIAVRHRRPGERWRQWVRRELRRWEDRHPDACYYYAPLDCGHQVQVKAVVPPQTGEVRWCPGHRRLGPARPVEVQQVPKRWHLLNGFDPERKSVDARP